MAKKKSDELVKIETKLELAEESQAQSEKYLETVSGDWDELEAMLIVDLQDDISQTTNSQVYDPRLSTIVYERASRVVAQLAKGQAYGTSKDDIGKSLFMNLMLRYYEGKANEQFRLLIKYRMLDLYSLVYGSMFGLVPWRVNPDGYIGPEFNIIPIRDAFPQPGKSVRDADWFVVRNVVSIDWLKKQSKDVWQNIDELEASIKQNPNDKVGGDEQHVRSTNKSASHIDNTLYPTAVSDVKFPHVETYTMYTGDEWITWTPRRVDQKTQKSFILRIIGDSDNPPYTKDGLLPTVGKDAFPLLDKPIGIGEFARGKTLQYALNSFINLFMDGVGLSVRPPAHVNIDNVVPSSLEWDDGAFWYMERPNVDVQLMNIPNTALNVFNSTYSFLVSALLNQSGTTDVVQSGSVESSLGKTPEAIKKLDQAQSSRDDWDAEMMESTVQDVYERWIKLTIEKQEVPVEQRLFAEELKDIAETHPDVVEIFESQKRGKVKIGKDMLDTEYDFVIEKGSMFRQSDGDEQENITGIIKSISENQALAEGLKAEGKTISWTEMFKRWLVLGGTKDWDKIIVDIPNAPKAEDMNPNLPPAEAEMPMAPEGAMPEGGLPVEPELPEAPLPEGNPQAFQDPDIQAAQQAAQEVLNGINGVPISG